MGVTWEPINTTTCKGSTFFAPKLREPLYDLPVTFDAQQAAEMAAPRFLRAPARLVMSALIGRVPIPDPIAAAVGQLPPNGLLPYSWNSKYPARIGVMPRSGGPATSGGSRWSRAMSSIR